MRFGKRSLKNKLQHDPPIRLLCNRLKSSLLEWPQFSISDVIQPIILPKTLKITSDCSRSSSSGSESDTDTNVNKVAAVHRVRKYVQRNMVTC